MKYRLQIARGGSFNDDPYLGRVVYRLRLRVIKNDYDISFRLTLSL